MSEKKPTIRFKGFDNDWEQRKFMELVKRINITSSSDTLPKVEFEDIVAGEGRLNKDISQKFDNRKGIEFEPDDILFGKLRPYLKNWLKPDFKGIALGDFWVFRANDNAPNFIFFLVQANRYQKAANDTAGTKMPRSDWKKVSNTDFLIPYSFDEQKKIGTFFQQLDHTITLHQQQLENLKKAKKGYLQKMFPKNNEKVPEIRFEGFTDDWEQRKFFDNIKNTIDFRGRTPKKLGMNWSESGYLALSALNVKNGYIDPYADAHYGDQKLYDKWMAGKELFEGQVLFTTEAPMGNVAQVPDDNKYILSQRTIAFDANSEKVTNDFLAVLLRSPKSFNQLSALASGGTAKGVSQKSLSQFKVTVPTDLEEQQKIGTFFKQLDDTITLHQRKLDYLKEMKKGLLQKMFV